MKKVLFQGQLNDKEEEKTLDIHHRNMKMTYDPSKADKDD